MRGSDFAWPKDIPVPGRPVCGPEVMTMSYRSAALVFILILALVPLNCLAETQSDADIVRSAWAAMDDGRHEEAFAMLWPLAQAGNAEAQTGIGVCLVTGMGVAQDAKGALRWFEKAAAQGHTRAAFNLARMYAQGIGVPQDCDEATRRYTELAESGDPMAQVNLAGLYAEGAACIDQDYRRAMHWYRAAADQGDPLAQHNLGAMFANGEGVNQSYPAAMDWYKLAAASGYADSQVTLGHMYQFGEGVEPDPVAAANYYRMAAAQGHAEAAFRLGYLYESGAGVREDIREALRWYRMAAEAGHGEAPGRIAAVERVERMAGEPIEDEALASMMAMPDLELAQMYERSNSLLGFIELAELGIEVNAGGRRIRKRNAARVRKELEGQVALCREAIDRRGSANIAGTYRVVVTPECERSKSGWAGLICQADIEEIVISQTGCEAIVVYEYEHEGKTSSIETPVSVVGSALTFQDFMNSDYVFVGRVDADGIHIRPDTESVLEAWPKWAGPPKRDALEHCEVTLLATN
jgi:TPR repeat protein